MKTVQIISLKEIFPNAFFQVKSKVIKQRVREDRGRGEKEEKRGEKKREGKWKEKRTERNPGLRLCAQADCAERNSKWASVKKICS